ncbi:Mucin-associated surface protein (MASP), subgroup S026 [Trypanosoma cruzi]|nr:Mucin-associated surface protein (MASP), subgroup S026 [Trypanosoma cruzi]
MAMMMTGRVLLVCALCVLWCGAGGRCDEDELPQASLLGASSSFVGKGLQESSPIAQGGSLNSVLEPISAKETRAETDEGRPSREEESSADEEEEEEEEEEEDEKEGILQPSSPPQSPKNEELKIINESGPKHENQRQIEGGIQNQSEKERVNNGEAIEIKQKEGSGPQPNNHQTPVQEENTINGEGHQQTQGKERQANVEDMPPRNSTGDYSSGEHNGNDGSNDVEEGEEGVEGHERDRAQEREEAAHVSGAPKVNSTDIQQEVQRTHAGETPTGMKQRAGEEKDDETEEEREEQKEQHQENPPGKEQETVTGANATNQINTTPGDNDGSTAVSHTTSPLLLLLLVACAAAAAVVAA